MKKRQKFSIWYVLLGVWVVLIVQNLVVSMFGIKTISYSEFLQLLKEEKVAQEMVFEDISTGAHNDLARATDIARSMVKECGMSDKVGQVYFAREKRNQFLNVPMEGATEYSEATAELIDSEVRQIISDQYSRTTEILNAKREIIDNGAKLLLEKEKIEGEELKTLMEATFA